MQLWKILGHKFVLRKEKEEYLGFIGNYCHSLEKQRNTIKNHM